MNEGYTGTGTVGPLPIKNLGQNELASELERLIGLHDKIRIKLDNYLTDEEKNLVNENLVVRVAALMEDKVSKKNHDEDDQENPEWGYTCKRTIYYMRNIILHEGARTDRKREDRKYCIKFYKKLNIGFNIGDQLRLDGDIVLRSLIEGCVDCIRQH